MDPEESLPYKVRKGTVRYGWRNMFSIKYKGQLCGDTPHGYCEEHDELGRIAYRGNWYMGEKLDGIHYIYARNYRDGVHTGCIYAEFMKRYVGQMKNGRYHGTGATFDYSGYAKKLTMNIYGTTIELPYVKSYGTFVDGKLQGMATTALRILKERKYTYVRAPFKDGEIHGEVCVGHYDTEVQCDKIIYDNGKPTHVLGYNDGQFIYDLDLIDMPHYSCCQLFIQSEWHIRYDSDHYMRTCGTYFKSRPVSVHTTDGTVLFKYQDGDFTYFSPDGPDFEKKGRTVRFFNRGNLWYEGTLPTVSLKCSHDFIAGTTRDWKIGLYVLFLQENPYGDPSSWRSFKDHQQVNRRYGSPNHGHGTTIRNLSALEKNFCTGQGKVFYPNGQVRLIATFMDGEVHEIHEAYYEDGVIMHNGYEEVPRPEREEMDLYFAFAPGKISMTRKVDEMGFTIHHCPEVTVWHRRDFYRFLKDDKTYEFNVSEHHGKLRCKFENGDIYDVDNIFSDHPITKDVIVDKDMYENYMGDRHEGVPHGEGRIDMGVKVFIGSFDHGFMHGSGRYEYPNLPGFTTNVEYDQGVLIKSKHDICGIKEVVKPPPVEDFLTIQPKNINWVTSNIHEFGEMFISNHSV